MSKSPIVHRSMAAVLATVLKQYPIVSITGPRQSGKTTLCHLMGHGYKYVNLEIQENRQFASQDPGQFLEQYQNGVILDEVQAVPELFPYLQYLTDKRQRKGEYILSGSQNFLLLEKISQSLAGRVAVFSLLPFSLKELSPYLSASQKKWESLCLRGFYPRLFANRKMDAGIFYKSYFQTYIQRDVRQIISVKDNRLFQQFIRLCANRVGTILNANDIGVKLGIDGKTVTRWLSVLEASYIIYLLPAYYENLDKRVVKKPKIYFYDTGLLCFLLGIKSEAGLTSHSMMGSIFENFIITECKKDYYNKGEEPELYFWQDTNQREIDLILDKKSVVQLFEIKSGKTPLAYFFKNLSSFKLLAKEKGKKVKSHVVYGGNESFKREGHELFSWTYLLEKQL
ncbi:MAG: ATP-binding protein [Chitinophagaceae bacterium]